MSNIAKKCFQAVTLGQFGSNSHPIHPATVHFPLTLFTLANVLNLVYGMVLYFPDNPFLSHDQQNLGTLSILGYAANVLGIITSIPAVVTGGAEFYAMVQGNGFYETKENGQKQLIPKVKTAFIHGGLNDLVIAGAVYNWLQERNVPDFKPAGHQIVMSAVFLAVQGYAAYLGGDLIYAHGVGVQRMGQAAKKKQQ
ncbi:hypothetical protein L207DRAFT_563741 [Hyaloscypha variabilis F]|uniref:DUF2231 domain-containing protein n=1 Tax=Hyaloscypha variabilis (strain UAMH 11265 / GT02V1 / F) TaxID=1149755 RepID=A0A2J6RWN1_HYAVF|nr:hypothetical protein L207DRAFT_563741 [Hyaloscypha variabilis F]